MRAKITKAGLAKELQCSAASITALLKREVIKTGPDATIDREAALRAIAEKTSGVAGGWGFGRHGKVSLRQRAEALLATARKPSHEKPPAGSDGEESLPADFALGAAFLVLSAQDRKRLDCLAQIATEALDLTAEQGHSLAKLFIYTLGVWIEDLLADCVGKNYAQEFQHRLSSWADENIAFAKETGGRLAAYEKAGK